MTTEVHNHDDHSHYHGVDKAEEHLSVNAAVKMLVGSISPVKSVRIRTSESSGRILAADLVSPADLPGRARSTRDGYAVNLSGNTTFKIVGEVRIGTVPKVLLKEGQAVRVATGSFIPSGANAVVMIEYSEVDDGKLLRLKREVKEYENILNAGEDVKRGDAILSKGARIFPQHVALFSLLGIRKINVYKKPRVAYFSTGDELVDTIKSSKKKGLYDATRPYIFSMLSELGADPVDLGIAKDNFSQIRRKMADGLRYDALILSAGSSVGERDFVSEAAASINGVKILVHGVAMRPSSPTGVASYKGKPFLLLPGFPTSAIMSFLVFARPAILKLSGSSNIEPITLKARMVDRYIGKQGLTHFVRVKAEKDAEGYWASVVRPTEAQFSGWMKDANAVAVIGESGVANADDLVDVFPIGEL